MDSPALVDARRAGRVLMLGPLPPPVGGMASVVANLRDGLRGRVRLRVLNTVKTTPVDRPLIQGIDAQLRLLWRLAAGCIGWRADLVHIHTCSRFTFWRNALDVILARLLGRPVVLHIHGARFHRFLAELGPVGAWSARTVLGLCSRVIVLGVGWKRVLDAWTDPHRVVVVPNGVAVAPLPADRARRPAGRLRILCLANYERRKGQTDLLQALAALEGPGPVSADLLGVEAEAGEGRRLRELADSLGLGDAVRVPGPVVGDEKARRLQAADCFCLPSYDEGLPMAMLEAMALGLAVVMTRVGAIPEVITDGVDGLLYEAGDLDGLRRQLNALVDDPDLARRIGDAGHTRVQRAFSLATATDRLLAIYTALGVSVRAGAAGDASPR